MLKRPEGEGEATQRRPPRPRRPAERKCDVDNMREGEFWDGPGRGAERERLHKRERPHTRERVRATERSHKRFHETERLNGMLRATTRSHKSNLARKCTDLRDERVRSREIQ
eukprot:357067-Chlamydomonas_euryale.AAC.1